MMRFKGASRGRGLARTTGALLAALSMAGAGCDLYFGEEEKSPIDEGFDPNGQCSNLGEDHGFDSGERFPLELGPTVSAEIPPPPISGGTLAIAPDNQTVVAADPDRDQVYVASLDSNSVLATIELQPGDEPGRVVVDDAMRAHVALRSGSAIVSIDLATNQVIERRNVCAAPRGLDMDALTGNLVVACQSGELVTINADTGILVSEQIIGNGLRDVVIDGDLLYVSKFTTAEVMVFDRAGEQLETILPPTLTTLTFDPNTGEQQDAVFEPAVAWRMIPNQQSEGVVLLHQRARNDLVTISRGGGYGGDECSGGVVHTAVTPIRTGQTPPTTSALGSAVLPVDLTLILGGSEAVIVSAGNGMNDIPFLPPLAQIPVDTRHEPFECFFGSQYEFSEAQPIAAASVLATDTVVVQSREPALLAVFPNGMTWSPIIIPLSDESRVDTGHELFHVNAGASVSCASCHPEGGKDGRVWKFECIGPRTTQSLQFGLLGTEPFHWDGDMADLSTLMSEVFVGRMGGSDPRGDQITAMGSWMDTLRPPPRPAPSDPAAVARGQALFENPVVGCATCHTGTKLTNNRSYDVGTGGTFQVPSLVGIANGAPFIHTGCASNLKERFTKDDCGGGDRHGVVSHLSDAELDDLVAYMKTL